MTLPVILVLLASLIAALTDLRERRIPNGLVAVLLVGGIIVNAHFGWQAVLADVAMASAIILAGAFAFSFKLIGGGDVKLLAAAAATLGYPDAIAFLLFTLVCGGALGIAVAVLRGRLRATLANVAAIAMPLAFGVRPARPQNGIAMPYALAIFSGALCLALLNLFAPHLRLLV